VKKPRTPFLASIMIGILFLHSLCIAAQRLPIPRASSSVQVATVLSHIAHAQKECQTLIDALTKTKTANATLTSDMIRVLTEQRALWSQLVSLISHFICDCNYEKDQFVLAQNEWYQFVQRLQSLTTAVDQSTQYNSQLLHTAADAIEQLYLSEGGNHVAWQTALIELSEPHT